MDVLACVAVSSQATSGDCESNVVLIVRNPLPVPAMGTETSGGGATGVIDANNANNAASAARKSPCRLNPVNVATV